MCSTDPDVAASVAITTGWAVAAAGDLNADGFGDFVVSAYLNDGGGIDAGRVYVFRGGPGPYPKFLTAAAAHYHLSGEVAGDGVGTSLATVRDLDGDGVRDLLVGQFGQGRLRVYQNVGTNQEPKFGKFEWFMAGDQIAEVAAS